MARRPIEQDSGKATTPDSQQPNTTPNFESVGQHSFLLQGMLELQRSFGGVEHAVKSLETKVTEQGNSLKTLEKVLWTGIGIVGVAGLLISFFVQHNYDRLAQLIIGTPPAVTSSPAGAPQLATVPARSKP